MKLKGYAVGLFFLITSWAVLANDPPPVTMLKQASEQMATQLDKNKGHLDTHTVSQIVHTVLLPHMDLESMSRSVVGREDWLKASVAEKEKFKRAFANLVIKVYSAPLASYDEDKIEFEPLRDPQAIRPQVKSLIVRKNGQRIPVSYRLARVGGVWKIYDFEVEGISMIYSYHSQFSSILQQGGGVPTLLRHLKG